MKTMMRIERGIKQKPKRRPTVQLVPKQQFAPSKQLPSLYSRYDMLWHGIPLWLVWVSCPGSAPFQLLAHCPTDRAREAEKSN